MNIYVYAYKCIYKNILCEYLCSIEYMIETQVNGNLRRK